MDPVIGLVCFTVLLASWFGGMSPSTLNDPFASFGFSEPLPAIDHVFVDFQLLAVILFTNTKLRQIASSEA